jgi:hypothetical protein
MKKLLLLFFVAPLLFSMSCGFYPTMMTKAYVVDTITSAIGRSSIGRAASREHIITQNDVTVIVEPFDVNEYFKSPHYTQNVKMQLKDSRDFPLIVNLYEGMSVFKLTILNNSNRHFGYSFASTEDSKTMNYNNRELISWDKYFYFGFWEDEKKIKTFPCYGQVVALLNKRAGKYYSKWNMDAAVRAIKDVINAVQDPYNPPPTPLLLGRTGGLGKGSKITGYIIFPEYYEAKQRDAKLDIIVDNMLFSFDVKATLQHYKSTYDKSILMRKYTPYVPITGDEFKEILKQEEETARKTRNRLSGADY